MLQSALEQASGSPLTRKDYSEPVGAARASVRLSCRLIRGLQFGFVPAPASNSFRVPLFPLGSFHCPVSSLTQAALDSQQKLVIANRRGVSPTAAIRYREMGHGPGLDLRAHLLAAIADHSCPAEMRHTTAVTAPWHAICRRQRPSKQKGPHILALIHDAPVGLRGGEVDRNALHVERREHLV